MFGRRQPIFVAFDVLVAHGEDVRAPPLARGKAMLKRLAKGASRWIALADGVPGHGRRLFALHRNCLSEAARMIRGYSQVQICTSSDDAESERRAFRA